MRRYYSGPSVFDLAAFFVRWFFRLGLLVLFLAGVDWLLTEALPAVLPLAAIGAVVVPVAGWLWSQLGG